ncbi:antirestriction protein ArdA [Parvularcula marina]|uniref:antirestriction protein ArdA n=1 Tax=Parvularcula marina TaxID=2292771 RepID=UPI0035132AAE
MCTQFYAQPYDISATGFYFDDITTYEARVTTCRNSAGDPVEEFEIQFIDGDTLDAQLFDALSVNQATIAIFIERLDAWDTDTKIRLIIATGECGCLFDPDRDDPEEIELDLYEVETLRELAEQFVEEGLFGDVPENFRFYIDYDAIARDLSADYGMAEAGNRRFAYRCG